MVTSSKMVEGLVDSQIETLKTNAQLLRERCDRWTDYGEKLLSDHRHDLAPLSPSEIAEIKRNHDSDDLKVDARSYLQSIQAKLQAKVDEQGGNLISELDSHKNDVANLISYKSDLDEWVSESKDRLERAIVSVDKELEFVHDFCRRNNISLEEGDE